MEPWEEEMEMSDDEIEETTERKETEESGKENPALLYVTNTYWEGLCLNEKINHGEVKIKPIRLEPAKTICEAT